MKYWRGSWLVAGKELRQMLRDPQGLLLVLGAPLLQLLVLGYALDTRARDLPVAVQDLDGGRLSRMLLARVSTHPTFAVKAYVRSEAELLGLLRRGGVKLAIQIPARYTEDAFSGRAVEVRVWVDGSDASSSAQALAEVRGIGAAQAIEIASMGIGELPAGPGMKTETLYNPEGRSAVAFVPALVGILAELTVRLLVSLSFVRERERGTMARLRSTGLHLASIVSGKIAFAFWVGVLVCAAMTAMMAGVFGIGIGAPAWLYALTMVTVLMPGLGLGLWLSAEAKTQAETLHLNFLIALPSVLLSGFLFPRASMPAPLVALSGFLPNTWALEAMRGMVVRGAALPEIGPALGALAGLGVGFGVIGWWRLRRS